MVDAADGRVNDSGSVDHDRDHVDSASYSADSSSGDGPFVVVYMVDSFTYGTQAGDGDDVASSRLATIGLAHCYSAMLKCIPDYLHSSIQLQVCYFIIFCCLFAINSEYLLIKYITLCLLRQVFYVQYKITHSFVCFNARFSGLLELLTVVQS